MKVKTKKQENIKSQYMEYLYESIYKICGECKLTYSMRKDIQMKAIEKYLENSLINGFNTSYNTKIMWYGQYQRNCNMSQSESLYLIRKQLG